MRLALLALLAAAAWGQDLTPRGRMQEGRLLLVGGTVHPVSGPAIEKGILAFEKGRIVEVGPMRDIDGHDRVVDVSGKHLWPGLISACTQLGLTEIGAVRATRDFEETGSVTPEVRAVVAINPDSTLLPVARSNGVLLAGVFPGGAGAIPGRAGVIRLDGWTWEEMTVVADAGVVVNWPLARPIRTWWMEMSEEQQVEQMRQGLEAIRGAFQSAAAWRTARGADPATPVDLRWEALAATPRVFFQAQEYDQIVSAVAFAAERGLRAVIVGGRDAWMCAELLRRHEVPVIAQGTVTLPRRADSDYDEPYRLPARLEAAGLRWCLQSGEEAAHERNLPYSAAMAVAHGLAHDVAIRSITLDAARILGIDDRYGSLEVGKSATLIVTDGDPLEVPTRVERAWIDGREVDLSNKQTALAVRYREKYGAR